MGEIPSNSVQIRAILASVSLRGAMNSLPSAGLEYTDASVSPRGMLSSAAGSVARDGGWLVRGGAQVGSRHRDLGQPATDHAGRGDGPLGRRDAARKALGALRFHVSRHHRVDGHAHVLPRVPVHGRHVPAVPGDELCRKGVEERVGRAVVGLSRTSVQRRERRAQDHEVERHCLEDAIEDDGPEGLWPQDVHGVGRCVELDHAATGDSRTVHDAVDRPEARKRSIDDRAHRVGVGHVGNLDDDLRSGALELAQRSNALAGRIVDCPRRGGRPTSPSVGTAGAQRARGAHGACGRDARRA